jgi:hypothetical protein
MIAWWNALDEMFPPSTHSIKQFSCRVSSNKLQSAGLQKANGITMVCMVERSFLKILFCRGTSGGKACPACKNYGAEFSKFRFDQSDSIFGPSVPPASIGRRWEMT